MADGQFETVKWKDIRVGDFIKIFKDTEVPADVLIVGLPEDQKVCYMQTSNLDGETNFKERKCFDLSATSNLSDRIGLERIYEAAGKVFVDRPNANIYEVNGYLRENGEKLDFDVNNTLLRATYLRNVEYVVGMVLYTGLDTKIMRNIETQPAKMSRIDRAINKMMVLLIIIVLMMTLIITLMGYIYRLFNVPDYALNELKSDYIYFDPDGNIEADLGLEIAKLFTSYYYIFNTIVPISLMINYESVKGSQVLLFSWDSLMTENKSDKFKIFNFRSQEDLGAVKYIFSDKTGTLTNNIMKFKDCAILGEQIGNRDVLESAANSETNVLCASFNKEKMLEKLNDDSNSMLVGETFDSKKTAAIEFLLNMAVNHDVLTEFNEETGEGMYQGSSPDEVAFVKAAAEMGIEFLDRSNDEIKVRVGNTIEVYELLHKLRFTSKRARSSVVIRDAYNNTKVYMKGADSVMFDKMGDLTGDKLRQAKENVSYFAKEGLRALCFSVKTMTFDQFYKWNSLYQELKASTDPRSKEKIVKLENDLESDHAFLGVTALEDELQEDAKECLKDFIDAGINVWMITGDNLDTAETIGYSCNLFNDDMEIFKIKDGDIDSTKAKIRNILVSIESLEEQHQKMEQIQDEKWNSPFKNKNFSEFYKNISSVQNEEEQTKKLSRGFFKNKELFHITKPIKYDFNAENMQPQLNVIGKDSILGASKYSAIEVVDIYKEKPSALRPMSADKRPSKYKTPNEASVMKFMEEKKYFDSNRGLKKEKEVIDSSQDAAEADLNMIRTKIKDTRERISSLGGDEKIQKLMSYGLMIEKSAISSCLSLENSDLFWELIQKCSSVICCRCLPIQKADVVSFVKKKSKEVTLSIGDGGNDVNMIKAANVGVGIFGKEGSQAAFNSDYAISKFKYLRRLIFRHGRYSLLRNSYFLYIYMHKNIVFSLPQLWFAFLSAFSGSVRL